MTASIRLRVTAIRHETRDVTTFVFRPESGSIDHAAGQSMTLRLPIDGEILHRTFSIASAPGSGDTIEMTVKAHPQGRATGWMRRSLAVGDLIEGQAPRGRFRIDGRSTDRLALVSAGSGASPLMAMLRYLSQTASGIDVTWVHWARTPSDVLFADELAVLQKRCAGLKVAVVVTAPKPGWFGFTGRPSRRLLSVAVPDLGRREIFCCGPSGFMSEMRLIHAAEGGDRNLFHVEHFGAVDEVAGPHSSADDASTGVEFAIRYAGKSFVARPDETLLGAATRQNVVIPCGCASGICGTCRVKLAAGRVDMKHNGGLSADDEAAGYILACSSRPRSDVSIEI
ncbi:MAG: iron-sulfur cluster-binding domain-containing protein [Proteobacteria bacterium]|nr:iron-sulfur cluster-binding domain-containing protein [Pseudomonadota bacterium]